MVSSEWQGDHAPSSDLRTDVPHSARMYDYYLGGKDNFAADREAAAKALEIFPDIAVAAQANRRFLGRAVRFAADLGIRQYLDIGTGIPASDNTHEVAQAIAPDSRVVYVDNDPIVLTHARALLAGTPEGRTAYLDADFHDHERILSAPETAELIDFTRPVALLTVALLHFVPDEDEPGEILERYKGVLPPGSVMIFSHATADLVENPEESRAVVSTYTASGVNLTVRSRDRVEEFFTGWNLVDPGVVPVTEWRPDGNPKDAALASSQAGAYGGVALKP
ncbi:SAM-dependent methyltransferase [Actinomadura madurae]|uniref:SAM-dependent methyltransferase n=1 Tax=Actinomadura madurae TaxID=1993 RepID=UPI0020D24CA6|nr:SAM-dependent methyltransferase [Actinomadura madurae]MCP9948069.1 SAM-dependent methyltransferase [Actinomadura madurae]MCP9964834.1 SAM-dependent methyltransferase [Actinomadura madurae]MCQ0011169.1 SAM-dependent methyltransferase [Actinomadura madurae]MCQ0013506.1 SAM-dependent methyltransferase [Actinomadura madurae]